MCMKSIFEGDGWGDLILLERLMLPLGLHRTKGFSFVDIWVKNFSAIVAQKTASNFMLKTDFRPIMNWHLLL